MSKSDAKRSKQQRRLLEDLDRGLRRGSVELVRGALLALPLDSAGERQDRVRALLRPKLAAACKARDARELQGWLAALDRRPDLAGWLDVGDPEIVWCLLWTAVKTNHYDACGKLWPLVAARVRESAPALSVAIEALLHGRGQPDLSLLPEIAEARPDVEVARPRRTPASAAPPAAPEVVEERLLELRAEAPWSAFAVTAEQWLSRAPAPCVPVLCAVIAELSVLELLEADSPDVGDETPAELVLAAERRLSELSASALGPSDSPLRSRLDDAFAIVVRAALGELWQERKKAPKRWIGAVIRRALGRPAFAQAVTSALSQAEMSPALASLAPVFQELHQKAPSPALWIRTALAIDVSAELMQDRKRQPSVSTWEWIEPNLHQHLSAPRELAGAIAALSTRDRSRLFDLLEEVLEPDAAAALVAALFPHAKPAERQHLVALGLVAVVDPGGATFCAECGTYHPRDGEDWSPAEMMPDDFRRFEHLEAMLLPYDQLFLKISLHLAKGRREQRAVFERYLVDDAPIDSYLHVLEEAKRLGLQLKPWRERLQARFSGKVAPLLRAFELTFSRLGPRNVICKEIAALLVAAVDGERPEALPSDLHRRLAIARRIMKRSKATQLALPLGSGVA